MNSQYPPPHNNETPHQNFLVGLHPLKIAIKNNYRFARIYLQKNRPSQHNEFFIAYAKKYHIPFQFIPKIELDRIANNESHQGFCAVLKKETRIIPDLQEFLQKLPPPSIPSFVLLLDKITDQQNVGALSRSACFFAASAIICENKHAAPIDKTVHKISAGASLIIPYFFTQNISKTLTLLKEFSFYAIAATLPNTTPQNLEPTPLHLFQPPKNQKRFALILGSEGSGVRQKLLSLSNASITIHNPSSLNSLNVSVAAGIFLYALTAKINPST